MRGLLLLVIVLAAVAAFVWWRRQQAAAAAPADRPVDPLRKDSRGIDPRKIKVGDVVAHESRDFLVRGTLRFDEDGFVWQEHLLDDVTTRRWLSVEDDEDLEIALWEAVDGSGLTPDATEVVHEGTTYRRKEQGRASFAAEGSTGTAPSGSVEYHDYAAEDGRLLSFERFGSSGDWEVGTGQKVNERTLDIYPSTTT